MGQIKDKGKLVEYDDKSIEFRNGARSSLNIANEFFTHFSDGSTIPAGLVLTAEGTAVAAATYGTGLGGWAVITSDDVLAKSHSLNGTGLNWQCNRQSADQPLVYETKVKVGTLATREFWFGMSDALADTDPIALSTTSTFTTSVPTDALVIGYSDTPTSGAAFLTGGNSHVAISIIADTNAVAGAGTSAFATDTFYTYRIEADAAGNAAWFVDRKFLISKGAAITATVPLTHIAYGIPRATAGSSEAVFTMDYVYMGGK